MKTLFSSLLLGGLLFALAPASEAQRVRASGHYGSYRYAPRYESSRVWIPGGYETVTRRVWVEGRVERVWVEPVYELRIGACGERFRVLVRGGYWRTIRHPGHYELRSVRVQVPGRWEKRC